MWPNSFSTNCTLDFELSTLENRNLWKKWKRYFDFNLTRIYCAKNGILYPKLMGTLWTFKEWLALKIRVRYGISIVFLSTSLHKVFSGYERSQLDSCLKLFAWWKGNFLDFVGQEYKYFINFRLHSRFLNKYKICIIYFYRRSIESILFSGSYANRTHWKYSIVLGS